MSNMFWLNRLGWKQQISETTENGWWNKIRRPFRRETIDDYNKEDDGIYRGEKYNPVEDCLHHRCPECHGTGTRKDGSMCVHMLSCPCRRCTPQFYHVS